MNKGITVKPLSTMAERSGGSIQPRLSPWQMVTGLGLVSLFADMAADGGKALYGPLLGSLGSSALVVGLVMGLSEATSLILRLATGSLADRKGNHWGWTIAGYGLTAVCIPLLAVSPFLGAAGVAVASSLIIIERVGKAFRSPSKTALLAHAAKAVGRGKGFGVHKMLDMIGAVSGPLLVAAILAAQKRIWLALVVLALPGLITMLILFTLRAKVPDPSIYSGEEAKSLSKVQGMSFWEQVIGRDLPGQFFVYALAVGLCTGGLVSFGIVGYHLETSGLVPLALIPLVFAAAMGVGSLAAFLNGFAYDRVGSRVLWILPFLVALVPVLALSDSTSLALVGMALWGFATGLQDSTIKAVVADLVPQDRLASAYGVFAAVQGLAALAGGVLAGWLYDSSRTALIAVVSLAQVVALVLFVMTSRRTARTAWLKG